MAIGRNDPCPCGSGLKHKKCCGAVVPIRAQPMAVTPVAATDRHCGSCTACCDGWVVGTIEGHEMKPGQACHFRGNGCCTIYERRPQSPCRTFACGWLRADSPFPEDFRPDQLGVIIIPTRWRGRAAYILRAAGRDPDDSLLAWMRAFSERSGCPFFYEQGGERYGFGPLEFQMEMADKLRRGDPLW